VVRVALSTRQRSALLAESHRLKPTVHVTADNLGPASIQQVREGFRKHALLKVRVNAQDGRACDAAAAELSRQVPCEVVKRVGRVVVLYRSDSAPQRATRPPEQSLG